MRRRRTGLILIVALIAGVMLILIVIVGLILILLVTVIVGLGAGVMLILIGLILIGLAAVLARRRPHGRGPSSVSRSCVSASAIITVVGAAVAAWRESLLPRETNGGEAAWAIQATAYTLDRRRRSGQPGRPYFRG